LAFVITEVSEECIAYAIRVERIGELGTTLAVNSNRRTLQRFHCSVRRLLFTANVVHSRTLATLMMEAIPLSETSVITRGSRCNIPEDGILHVFDTFPK
jgi:hypothetical protein